jgi:hypothetical protein
MWRELAPWHCLIQNCQEFDVELCDRIFTIMVITHYFDSLCGLVVRVLGYRSGDPGSIPGTIRFSKKKKRKQ